MKVWWFDGFFWLVAFWVSFCFSFFLFVVSWVLPGVCLSVCGYVSSYFCFDVVSLYLVVLTLFISCCVVVLSPWLSLEVVCLVFISQFFSLLCYVCCHVLFFWVCYEVGIVSLLYLLVKYSPYSERYVAFWYFLGYVLFCSLPMLLIFLYYSLIYGSFSVYGWDLCVSEDWWILLLVSLLFITKIPLFPFQAWLPIVHAEASSVVSVCLSGYIMKLGVLGVFRFGYWVLPDILFGEVYVGLMLLVALFLFLFSGFELDGKRWLAFLSLSHISVVPLCLCVSEGFDYDVGFCYCLGHGLSSSVTFILFWFLCEVSGSRNLVMLKGAFAGSMFWGLLVVSSFCLCASFPPCLQFFCELLLVGRVGLFSGLLFCVFCCYLFLSGLVVLTYLGTLLVRCYDVRPCGGLFYVSVGALWFLLVLNCFCFLFF